MKSEDAIERRPAGILYMLQQHDRRGIMRSLRLTQRAVAIAILTCATALCQPKHEPKYAIEFTSVVDSTADFNAFGGFPAINNHGEVAFTAARSGTSGIFRAREDMEGLASTKDDLNGFGADVSISPAGAVAFGATTSSNSRALFKGDGKSRTLIVDSTPSGFVGRVLGSPSVFLHRLATVTDRHLSPYSPIIREYFWRLLPFSLRILLAGIG
jgi:hypothetical protein